MSVSPIRTARTAPAVPDAEPCVICEHEAADNWLICLECACRVDDTMLVELAQKYSRLQSWLPRAEAALELMSRTDPRRIQGHQAWLRKLRVYERIEEMDNVVQAGGS